jgi:diaminopimelate decarboxylase/aspartate kinase
MNPATLNPNWVVLKFGGTSVAGKPQWLTIASLLQQRLAQGKRVLLVCSAVSGVTNRLSELADAPSEQALQAILDIHTRLAAELEIPRGEWLDQARRRMQSCMSRLQQDEDHAARADLLAVGEWLSTKIGAEFLKPLLPLDWLDIREHLTARDEPDLSAARQWLSASCEPGPEPAFQRACSVLHPVVITQGYIASNRDGATVLLGRGGSDTSAALLAGRLGAESVEIWTDVPGLFSADPRLVPNARLLEELQFAEALEMAAAGAKVVHPRCISAAEATGTTIHIRDTGRAQLLGTRITRSAESGSGVKSITCQKDMLVLLLQKIDIRREVGFLASVFEIFRQRGISIDLVATSETTTTVALNRAANLLDEAALQALLIDLRQHSRVEVHADCVCVNLVGTAVRTVLSRLQSSMAFFAERPLLMLSQSANDLCLSLLMPAAEHELLVRQLHEELVTKPAAGPGADNGPKFGPSWLDLQQAGQS